MNRDRYLSGTHRQQATTGGSALESGLEGARSATLDQALRGATELLEEFLRRASPETRIALLEAIARSDSDQPIEELQRRLLGGSIREAEQVVLSLGFERSPRAMEELFALIEDSPEARRHMQRSAAVPMSVRVQAAASIGVFASHPGRGLLNQMVSDRLARLVALEPDLPQELQKAAILALGSTLPRDGVPSAKRLMALFEQRSRANDVLAQVPVAAAKLVMSGNARSEVVAECVREQLALLRNRRQSAAVRQGAAQGLGVLAVHPQVDTQQVVDALHRAMREDPNALVRQLATMSLAYAGARDGGSSLLCIEEVVPRLLQQLRESRGENRSWAALALGVLGARLIDAEAEPLPEQVGRTLLDLFSESSTASTRSALALSLGLIGHRPAIDPLHQAWHASADPGFLRSCTLALGLLDAEETLGDLQFMLQHSGADTWTMRDAAQGLELMRPGAGVAGLRDALLQDSGRSPRGRAAAEALRCCAASSSFEVVRQLLDRPHTEDPELLDSLCRHLGRLLNPSDWDLRSRFVSDLNPAQLPAWLTGDNGLLHRL